VIGSGIVKVDGLFHKAQPKRACVEIHIPRWVSRDSGDVMDAGHGVPSSSLCPSLTWSHHLDHATAAALRAVLIEPSVNLDGHLKKALLDDVRRPHE
jgi:hypothetical protein